MDISVEKLSSTQVILRPAGRLDVVSSAEFHKEMISAIEAGATALVIDLEQITFMDSSGLRVLVSALKALRRKGGGLAICKPNSQIRTALRLTMLDRVFPAHDSPVAAFNDIEADRNSGSFS